MRDGFISCWGGGGFPLLSKRYNTIDENMKKDKMTIKREEVGQREGSDQNKTGRGSHIF
jgi:hypothetical protein